MKNYYLLFSLFFSLVGMAAREKAPRKGGGVVRRLLSDVRRSVNKRGRSLKRKNPFKSLLGNGTFSGVLRVRRSGEERKKRSKKRVFTPDEVNKMARELMRKREEDRARSLRKLALPVKQPRKPVGTPKEPMPGEEGYDLTGCKIKYEAKTPPPF